MLPWELIIQKFAKFISNSNMFVNIITLLYYCEFHEQEFLNDQCQYLRSSALCLVICAEWNNDKYELILSCLISAQYDSTKENIHEIYISRWVNIVGAIQRDWSPQISWMHHVDLNKATMFASTVRRDLKTHTVRYTNNCPFIGSIKQFITCLFYIICELTLVWLIEECS